MVTLSAVIPKLGTAVLLTALVTAVQATTCCDRLIAALPDVVFCPSDLEYAPANAQRWSQTAILSPSCIVRPLTAEDISTAIKILADVNGNASACAFSIKAGGHNPNVGFDNLEDGISLDLSFLNQTKALSEHILRLGGGGTWQNAYNKVPNMSFAGGVCGGTGVGGVALGGGMSLFLAEAGWVADNVCNFEVVLGSGAIVNANATSNADLFMALKGGSSNFGVVTSLDLETTQGDGTIYGGQILSPAYPNVTAKVLQGVARFTQENNLDSHAGLQVVFVYSSSGVAVVDSLIAHTDGVNDAPILQHFLDIEPQLNNTVGLVTMSSIGEQASQLQPSGYRDLTATVTFENDLSTLAVVHNATLVVYEQIKAIPNMDFIFSYVPLPWLVVAQSEKRGGTMLGLQRKQRDRISMFISPRWQDKRYDARMYKAAKTWVHSVTALTKELNTDDDFLYLNFAGGFQDPLASYGSANVEFMKNVARKYDPEGVFQHLMPGGFKLGK